MIASLGTTFAEKCVMHGLDPDQTSILELACAQRGLDPKVTRNFAIACRDYRLDPEKTSFVDLARARGITVSNRCGDIDWIARACHYSI